MGAIGGFSPLTWVKTMTVRTTRAAVARPTNFMRWFAAMGFLTVTAGAIATAATLSHYLAREMFQWDAVMTAEFVVTVAETESNFKRFVRKTGVGELLGKAATAAELGVSEAAAEESIEELLDHIRALPGAASIMVYARDRSLVWARYGTHPPQAPDATAQRFLASAFELPYTGPFSALGRWDYRPAEPRLDRPASYWVENYVPLYDAQRRVAAVIMIGKEPGLLQQIIHSGQLAVWICVMAAGMLTFASLFWLARGAAVVMRDQQRRLVESEKLSVVGEMSLAVAHGIRNPLAAIRSSAEIALEDAPQSSRKQLADIIVQSDRLSSWLRELLLYSRPELGPPQPVCLVEVLRESVNSYSARLTQAGIAVECILPETPVPSIKADRPLLRQAFNSVISNAVEAMSGGGKLTVRCALRQPQGPLVVSVRDTGPGMSRERLAESFVPFRTSKARGLGVGLSLVKSTLQRYGGHVCIHSREHEGTCVELVIPLSR